MRMVEVENLVPVIRQGSDGADPAPLPMLYFCIPQNDKMLGYWDTVADRLYKIRHCMNIEGVVRQLALFEPPIDPGALVKAVAGGLDISSALADLNAPLPLYRFNVLLQKANEVCNDVKALGGALLARTGKEGRRGNGFAAPEPGNSCARSGESSPGKANRRGQGKSGRSEEIENDVVETRRSYYRDIERSDCERKPTSRLNWPNRTPSRVAAQASKTCGLHNLDSSPHLTWAFLVLAAPRTWPELQSADWSSDRPCGPCQRQTSFFSQMAANDASMASAVAGYDRRWDDWKHQERLAERELDQLDGRSQPPNCGSPSPKKSWTIMSCR